MNRLRCRVVYRLMWVQRSEGSVYYMEAQIPLCEGQFWGRHLPASPTTVKYSEYPDMSRKLFGVWQQQCSLSLSLLSQLVVVAIVCIGEPCCISQFTGTIQCQPTEVKHCKPISSWVCLNYAHSNHILAYNTVGSLTICKR